jgi:hypothetical protein
MKFFFVILLSLFLTGTGNTQLKTYPFYQLYQLDSIAKTPSVCRHFGKLYFDFLTLVEEKLQHADTVTQRLVRNFESVFAQFYIAACVAYGKNVPASLFAWRPYFKDSTLQFYQYYLLGTNAHLNGGLAEAIGRSYTPEQWKWVKKKYYLFNSCLNKTYRYVYAETWHNNRRVKLFHTITFGLDRLTGYYLLYKWRKRQMRLMKYYFTGSPQYQKLLQKINCKKKTIDFLVVSQLRVPYRPPKEKNMPPPAIAGRNK